MRTLRQTGEHETEIKKSRFLCSLTPVTSEQEAREVIAQRKRAHHEARHNCSAFVLGDRGEVQKSSDDGEPAGTAGVPMLEVLRRNEITNAVAVVTRYFGGVLLGAGGLIRAYGGAVSEALEVVGTVQRRPVRVVFVTADYATAGKLDNELHSAGHHVAGVEYGDRARFHVHVPEESVDELRSWLGEVTAGAAEVELGEVLFAEV
ncbi:YigZ family protein [Salinifilum aidingensis]